MSKEFPEVNEIILGTVNTVKVTSVFVKLKDYPLEGVINFSEVAPGRIRNIRDYVRPGQQIAVKVLRIDISKKHVDLSLRRVSNKEKKLAMESERKEKELIALLSLVIKDPTKIQGFVENIKEFGISDFFEEALKKEDVSLKVLKEAGLAEKEALLLLQRIKDKIKTKKVFVKSKINLKCTESDGIERIKKVLNVDSGNISYISAPEYVLSIEDNDYKSANKKMDMLIQELEKRAKQNVCEIEIVRGGKK